MAVHAISANVVHSAYSNLIILKRYSTALKEYPIKYFTLTECIKLYEFCEGEPMHVCHSLNSSYFYQLQIKSLSAIKIWQEINVKITSIQDQYINVIFY